MPKIDVTDEQYEVLKKMSQSMVMQDSRATRLPLYCVAEWVMEPAHEDCGDLQYYLPNSEGTTFTEDELQKMFKDKEEFLCEFGTGNEQKDNELYNKIKENIDEYDINCLIDFLEATAIWLTRVRRIVDGQIYLTEKGAQRHIDNNGYHYLEPHVYVTSCWRNYELETLMDVVHDIENEGGAHR